MSDTADTPSQAAHTTHLEIYWRMCKAAVENPVILTDNPVFDDGHKRAYLGVDGSQMKRILDECGKYYAYQEMIVNNLIAEFGLWTEEYYNKGKADFHIFVHTDDVGKYFPEHASLISSVLTYNQKVHKGEWVKAWDCFDTFLVTSAEYEPYYQGSGNGYTKVLEEATDYPQYEWDMNNLDAPKEVFLEVLSRTREGVYVGVEKLTNNRDGLPKWGRYQSYPPETVGRILDSLTAKGNLQSKGDRYRARVRTDHGQRAYFYNGGWYA